MSPGPSKILITIYLISFFFYRVKSICIEDQNSELTKKIESFCQNMEQATILAVLDPFIVNPPSCHVGNIHKKFLALLAISVFTTKSANVIKKHCIKL